MRRDPETIGAQMDALGLWKELAPYNFALKPRGTVFPYFCTTLPGDAEGPVKARFLMLEGWQTLHDYVRTRYDRNFGFYSSPLEFPHYELVGFDGKSGEKLFERRVSPTSEGGLRTLWETMPAQVLHEVIRLGKVPGEIRVKSGRVFRMMRPLCLELPFKLSLHDNL